MISPPSIDVERLRRSLSLAAIYYSQQIGSTNDAALERAREGGHGDEAPGGGFELFLAERQTAGRGRGGNAWWAGPGGLTFSLLSPPVETPRHRTPAVALAAGAAICEATRRVAPALAPRLKWPNDLHLVGLDGAPRKAGGVLVEVAACRTPRVVIGVGMNVNTRVADAPPEIRSTATSLLDAAGPGAEPFDRTVVLIEIVKALAAAFDRWAAGDLALPDLWRSYSLLTGKRVRIESPAGDIAGLCETIDDDGALVVRTDSGVERCVSGVVAEFF